MIPKKPAREKLAGILCSCTFLGIPDFNFDVGASSGDVHTGQGLEALKHELFCQFSNLQRGRHDSGYEISCSATAVCGKGGAGSFPCSHTGKRFERESPEMLGAGRWSAARCCVLSARYT